MPVRQKHGRRAVVSTPQKKSEGRRASLAVAAHAPSLRGKPDVTAAVRLVDALIGAVAPGADRAAKRRPKDVRHQMTRDGHGELARSITIALASDGGWLVRTIATAHVDVRSALYRAAHRMVAVRQEHGIESSAADGELLRAVLADALALAIVGQVAARGLGGDAPAAIKLANTLASTARLDLHSALTIAREANEHRPPGLDPAVAERMAAVLESRRQREREALEAEGEDGTDGRAGDPVAGQESASPDTTEDDGERS